jgi:hypothetical protein
MKNLTEKALLVNLKIAQWSARKYDRKVTNEVNAAHNAKDAGRFNKILLAKENLDAINKVATRARTFHYENTLPWSDTGERLLPSDNYFEYVGKLSELKNEFESVVRMFVQDYPEMIEQAKHDLNGLFNAYDYPANIGDRFQIKSSFMPVPDVQDLRVDLSAKEVDHIRETMAAEITDRFANAQRDIYGRIAEQLRYMRERLNEADAVFRDSLFENILSLVELLPRLNVAGDANITAVCNDLKSIYCDPENVRKDKKLRADKAKEVEAMLSKIDSFLKPQ